MCRVLLAPPVPVVILDLLAPLALMAFVDRLDPPAPPELLELRVRLETKVSVVRRARREPKVPLVSPA